MAKLVEAIAAEVTKLHHNLDFEMCSYMKYCQSVQCRLHEIHETIGG
jgi:hypothetical protein